MIDTDNFNFLRVIFDAPHDAMLIVDATYRVILANAVAERLYGYSSAELSTKNTIRSRRYPFRDWTDAAVIRTRRYQMGNHPYPKRRHLFPRGTQF